MKFQTFSADRQVTKTAPKAEYQISLKNRQETQYEMLKKLELDKDAHKELISHCQSRDIKFFSTAFDVESVDLLSKLGQKIFKIPSGEITNRPLIKHIGKLSGDVILSTGMSDMSDIQNALLVLVDCGTPLEKITVLHCTTAYPTPIEDVNLRAMISIQQRFGVQIGYSDHTQGIEVAIAAASLGASIIEKHFTLDRNLPGPDHNASLEPQELSAMIKAIRNIEIALGDGNKRVMPSESLNRNIARKSIVAKRKILRGEILTEENMTQKRPGNGISPMQWDTLAGSYATRDFATDELIEQ